MIRILKSLSNNWSDLARIFTLIGIGILAVLYFNQLHSAAAQAQVNAQLLRNQENLILQLKQAGDARDKSVNYLIQDNAQQTVILCKLILANGNSFSQADTATIEQICKEKAKQADGLTLNSQPAPTQTPQNSPSNTNTQNTNQKAENSQSPQTQPSQSGLVETLNRDIVKPVTNIVKGIF